MRVETLAADDGRWDQLVDAAPVPDVYFRPGYGRAYESVGEGRLVAVRTEGALFPLLLRELPFGEDGLDAITPYLVPGHTLVVLGSSGVGKSTLINQLVGNQRLATQEVRDSDHRGKHTTTHRELIVLPGGALLIDTPGIRELQLWSSDSGVAEAFDDISALAPQCYFANCQHAQEPKCAVKQAVADGRLPADRLHSFHKLRGEQDALTARQDVMAQQARKKRDRIGARAVRAVTKLKDRT